MTPALVLLLAVDADWRAYGGDTGGSRYSPAAQIKRANVGRLRVAWRIKTRDLYRPKDGRPSALETTPLYVNGTLYLTSALGRVIAADPATGAERWSYDPKVDPAKGYGDFTNRGVSYHASGLVVGVSVDARMFALDAKSGARRWEVNLREGLRIAPRGFADYEQTSPPCVVGDVVVVGSAVADNGATDMASGEVRGFDVKTGRKLWTWDPAPGTRMGGANAWSVIAGDEKTGIVYVPTGSASPDYYGGERVGKDNFANSAVALDSRTGKVVWHFRTVYHDLWDYDVASPPALIRAAGRDAVAVGSKTGHVFILDRATGKPVFGVEERAVPKSDTEGEQASPVQPFPLKPPPLVPHRAEIRAECVELVRGLRNEGVFTPPSPKGSLVVPGNIGGLHWGGVAFDPEAGLLIAPANHLPALVRLIPRERFAEARREDRMDMEFAPQRGTPYGMARTFLLAPDGRPCHTGATSTLSAIDTKTGDLRWQVPLGDLINLGGPITTAGGLTFIGAAVDGYFRAFDTRTGAEVWKFKLPASARSTPMTYVHNGKQYVAISAGGHNERFGPLGDEVLGFALPD